LVTKQRSEEVALVLRERERKLIFLQESEKDGMQVSWKIRWPPHKLQISGVQNTFPILDKIIKIRYR
jgi:hypothetical protein